MSVHEFNAEWQVPGQSVVTRRASLPSFINVLVRYDDGTAKVRRYRLDPEEIETWPEDVTP